MSAPPERPLVKIQAEIAGLEGLDGEQLWAEPLGDDLYRIESLPFYAYDVHFRDIIRAVQRAPDDELLTVVEVVRPSGYKTLRVMFDMELPHEEVEHLLGALTARKVEYEHSEGYFYALNVPPDADYEGVCRMLWSLENAGSLNYETGTVAPEPS